MMTLEDIKNRVVRATEIAMTQLPVKDSLTKIEMKSSQLLQAISNERFIKIPFVGDFSSGKSSLLNSIIGRNLLPTDILPETAVAYELYYSAEEKLELYSDGNLKRVVPSLDDIKSVSVKPGDVVYVYINNERIRDLNNKGIVLVDMPGIDSGIEAHNNAILSYIKEGTIFLLFNDVEQGTLKSSTISFIREIKQYGLGVNVFVSKADKKPEEEVEKVRSEIEETVKSIVCSESRVGVTSAVEEKYGYKDVMTSLEAIDAESILVEKYKAEADIFVDSIIGQFELQINLTMSDAQDFDGMLEQLSNKKRMAIATLQAKASEAQSVEDSVGDILMDLRNALMANAQKLAVVAFSSNGNTNAFEAEIMSIIRPVLIESFRREMIEYQETIGESIRDLSVDVSAILNEKSRGEGIAIDVLEKVGGFAFVEQLLQKGIAALISKFAGKKALVLLLRGLSPVIGIILSFIPDIISLIFGKSNEQKIAEIRNKIEGEVIGQVVEKLRENIEQMLVQTRQEAYDEVQKQIDETIKQIDDNISAIKDQKASSESEIQEKVTHYRNIVNNLKAA